MNRKFIFFAYLLESYANHKGETPANVLNKLDVKKLTDFVYDMYEMYHTESIENAFADLDSLIATGKPAW